MSFRDAAESREQRQASAAGFVRKFASTRRLWSRRFWDQISCTEKHWSWKIDLRSVEQHHCNTSRQDI